MNISSYWVLKRSLGAPGDSILAWCRWWRRLESPQKPIYTRGPQLAAVATGWLLALSAERHGMTYGNEDSNNT